MISPVNGKEYDLSKGAEIKRYLDDHSLHGEDANTELRRQIMGKAAGDTLNQIEADIGNTIDFVCGGAPKHD